MSYSYNIKTRLNRRTRLARATLWNQRCLSRSERTSRSRSFPPFLHWNWANCLG